jgi:hypothetical protein
MTCPDSGKDRLLPFSYYNMKKVRKPKEKRMKKKQYVKPKIRSQKVFETAALACGKCASGPTNQLGCKRAKKFS